MKKAAATTILLLLGFYATCNITIIFKKNGNPTEVKLKSGRISSFVQSISYFNRNFGVEVSQQITNKGKDDTINISACGSLPTYVKYYHKMYGVEYILYQNDTAIIYYNNNKPICKIKNRHVEPNSLNFDANIISANENKITANLPEGYYSEFSTFPNYKTITNSLRNKKHSENYELYYKTRIYIDSVAEVNCNKLESLDDSLLNYNLYRDQLIAKLFNKSDEINYVDIFDSISKHKSLSINKQLFILDNLLPQIRDNSSFSDFKRCRSIVIARSANQEYAEYITKTYPIFENTKPSILASVVDAKNQAVDLEYVIKNLHGKIVLVDIWASWCSPCLLSIPYALKIREEYKNKNVAVIFLSTDTDNQKWLTALNKYVYNSPLNYRLIDLTSTKLFKDIQLRSIPRYLIFDANGTLIHINAPSPKTDELRKILDSLLNKMNQS